MIRKFLISALVAILFVSCKDTKKGSETNPNPKYQEPLVLDGIGHGLIKPPVNILSSDSDSLSYQIHLSGELMEGDSIISGETKELKFGPESPILIGGSPVDFKQIHFHTPSYHLIEGREYPVEFHVITVPQESGSNPAYLIISILFDIGEHNQFIGELLQKSADKGNTVQQEQFNILLGGRAMVNKTNDNLDGFYHYIGPLATEPYTNSVQWYIARRVFEISPEQLDIIKKMRLQE